MDKRPACDIRPMRLLKQTQEESDLLALTENFADAVQEKFELTSAERVVVMQHVYDAVPLALGWKL